MGLKTKPIFVDTSWWKALVDENDSFHVQALGQLARLRATGSRLVTSNYILDESFTLIRVRINRQKVDEFRKVLTDLAKALTLLRVTAADESGAWEWFGQDWSKLSYTDCVSFAMMKRIGLTEVATFDEHYGRAGFRIMGE